PAAQSVTVSGTPGPINFTVSASAGGTGNDGTWLTATPASGTTNATVQVSVSAGSLPPAAYTGTVTITGAGATGSPISIPVTFNVAQPQTLTAAPASLSFSYTIGLAAPQGQTVQLTSSGTNTPFTVTMKTADGGSWLAATPASGNTPGSLTVAISPTGLAAGNYTGTITVNSPNALTPASIPVTLSVVAIPPPVVSSVGNAASYALGGVSPGEN